MIKDEKAYLNDIAKAVYRIEELLSKTSREEFNNEWPIQDAFFRELAVIGEAAGKLPDKVTEKYPEINWNQIVGMRNVLIHDYTNIDLDIVWDTVTIGIPQFTEAFKELPEYQPEQAA